MKLIKLDEVTSTNDELKKLAESGAKSLTVVTAKSQTAGRGRLGNGWVSQDGNLYLSILLRDVRAVNAHQLSHIFGLAAIETIESYLLDDEVQLKWPNDVLVDGKKIAGILLESSYKGEELDYVVAGIGINVSNFPQDVATPATSLKDRGSEPSLDELRDLFVDAFTEYMELWLTEGFERIGNLWMLSAAFLDEKISVNTADGKLDGIFRGLAPRGEMILEVNGEEKIINSGEVS